MADYYNRYGGFNINEVSTSVPFVKIPEKATDKFIVYKVGKTRLDKVSQEEYGTPYFGFLILLANPEYSEEKKIPDQAALRVPFPLKDSIRDYKNALNLILRYYGE